MKKTDQLFNIVLLAFSFFILPACDVKPRALKPGADNCHYCQMTIADMRFGSEILTKKGKIFVFDDAHCTLAFLREKTVAPEDIKDVYLSDYSGNHELVSIRKAHLYRSEAFRSPMGGNIAAFENMDSLVAAIQGLEGDRVIWDDLLK